MNITITQDLIFTSVISYLKELTGYDQEHIRRAFQDNIGVPEDYPYVYVTLLNPKRNATNEHKYDSQSEGMIVKTSMLLDVQLDFYGQDSIDQANIVCQLFRDEFSVNFFQDSGLVPLDSDDVIGNVGSEDENSNWKIRNILTLHFNIHPEVVAPQQFFDSINLISSQIDAKKKNDVVINI